MKDKPELIIVDLCSAANGESTIRWADGSENGDTERQPVATVYDHNDAQGIVDAWNACQFNGVNTSAYAAFRNDVDGFLQILEAHKAQYNGSQAQRVFAEELCKLEGKLKTHIKSFK